ncbi:hypothetical protein VSAK1_22604 [Vibrio mediterranei AK1]|uniref:hypothetical protein n=1 Tax=Vibrio mediterranei TaxID=689 RepID=UPI0001540DFB|nr:hypothetical protein [Vibrio mediterranei]EDL55379.1 hypothetical protein VSAK1_22604 [Vibrio mediterranei AK1]
MNLNKYNLFNLFKLSIFSIILVLFFGCRSDGDYISDSIEHDANKDTVYFVSAEVDEVIRIEGGYSLKINNYDEGVVDIINENMVIAKKPGLVLLENINGSMIELDISKEKTVDFSFSRKSLVQETLYEKYLYDLSVSSVVFSDIEGIVDIRLTELNNSYIEVVNSGDSKSTSRPLGHQVSLSFPKPGTYSMIIKFNDREFLKVIDVIENKEYEGTLKVRNTADMVEGEVWVPSVTNINKRNVLSLADKEVLTYSIDGDNYNYFSYLDRIRSLTPATYIISVSSGELQSNNSLLTVKPFSEWLDINFQNISLPDKVYSELTNVIDLSPYKGEGKLSVSIEGVEIFDNKIRVLDKSINDFELTLEIGRHTKSKRIIVEHGEFIFKRFVTGTNVIVDKNKSTYGDKFIFSDIQNGNGYWYWLEFINMGDGTWHRLSPFELPKTETCSFRFGEIDKISISSQNINVNNNNNGYVDNVMDFVCSSSVNSQTIRVSDSRKLEPEQKFSYSLSKSQDITFSLTLLGDYILDSLPLLVTNNFNAESIPVFDFNDTLVSTESASNIHMDEFGELFFDSDIQNGTTVNIMSNTYPELNKNIFLSIEPINANNVEVVNGDISSNVVLSDYYIVDGARNIKSDNVKQIRDLEVALLVLDDINGKVHDISEHVNLESTSHDSGFDIIDKRLMIDTSLSPRTYPVNVHGPSDEFITNFDVEVLDAPINLTTRFNLKTSTGKFGTGKSISLELTELSGKKIRLPIGVMNNVDSWRFGLEASSQLFSSSGGRVLVADKEVLDEISPIGSSYRNNLLIEQDLSNSISDVCNVFEGDVISSVIQCNSIP